MNLDSANLLRSVGRTPRSAADPLVGLLGLSTEYGGAGPGGPARTRGSAPQYGEVWHLQPVEDSL